MGVGTKILFVIWLIITLAVISLLIVFGDVIDKLEVACNEYNMDYEYREGINCLDKQNVLHPISSECGAFRWDECEIRFIIT